MADAAFPSEEESRGSGRSSFIRILPLTNTPSPRLCVPGSEQQEMKKGKLTSFFQLLSLRLGMEDLCNLQVWRASVGELVGTAVLVFAIGTITISSYVSGFKPPGLLAAILVCVAVSIILLAISPISGSHINPAVSLAAALVGVISPAHAAIYMTVQCGGAILGSLALRSVVSETIQTAFSLCGCTLGTMVTGEDGLPVRIGVDTEAGFWMEFLSTFILLFGSIWMAFDSRQAKALGRQSVCVTIGVVVGLMGFVSSTVRKGYPGVGMNPARCFGAAVVRGGRLWEDHWVFWAGPATASLAFYLYTKLVPEDHFHGKHDFKYDFFTTLKLVTGSLSPASVN